MAVYDPAHDPATLQTAAGYPQVKTLGTDFIFTAREKQTLADLARQVAEIAARPEMDRKARLWTAHNDLKTDVPLVFIDPENGWNEIIPAGSLACQDPLARVWEMCLRKQIYWADRLRDDKVIEPYFDVPFSYTDTGWGLTPILEGGGNGGAYHIKKAIDRYEEDFPKLHEPQILIDGDESARVMELALEVFDGILTVRRKNTWWWTLGMTYDYVNLRGMEDFMCDFLLESEWVTRMMNLLCEGKLHMLDFLEQNGLLALNNGGTYVGSGGFGFTDELPRAGKKDRVVTQDLWGFCDAQETVRMNPDLYGEFVFPYHKRILERFGLSCYGCCEGYDNRWKYAKNLPHLRRVSVSPWANWSTVPENLGKNFIASVKPNPTALASARMDENAVREDCRRAVSETRGGICEFLMKDNNTLGHNPDNAIRWVQIMREEIDRAL